MKTALGQLVMMVVAVLALGVSAVAAPSPGGGVSPHGDGMPLPWPFPWAQHCSVDWVAKQGRYSLMESRGGQEIELVVTDTGGNGTQLVHMIHYAHDGTLIDDGFTYIGHGQKIIRLWLRPSDTNHVETMAVLRLYHSSVDLMCNEDHLVAILTLSRGDGESRVQTQYRLERAKSKN